MSSQTYFKRKIFNWLEEANFFNKQAVCIFIYLILSMSFLPGIHRLCIFFLYVNLKTDDFSTFCLGCNIHITLVLIALGLSRIQNYCTFPITVYTLFQTFETKWKFTKMEMWYSYNLLVKAQCDQKKKTLQEDKNGTFSKLLRKIHSTERWCSCSCIHLYSPIFHILQFEEHCRQEMDMEGQGRGSPSLLCLTKSHAFYLLTQNNALPCVR